ncbi:hypothetical protein FRACYDRAFT_244869 [Fragilariopsis cylindrus CCMP1102]|uniref:Cyanocobalamin reductase (cyanide-eliminating) n=1 Tax=Fragilariopsis cylindrus CCMP1102 TaxID=635003 RepID=A0A1E7F0X1_9STRA|nr:hypothetical protein FRACYDRAFT_244869 [Fragilariopsis cylindrus CCMP1102]|eukprot:OEU11746.1 hypothetical protein FRACYDRAFT_244869 [Fragilariopsis cylindrus CCMP1102]
MKSSSNSSSFDEIRLKENLFKAGFDICHGPFSPKLYNDRIEEDGLIESGTLFPLPETITAYLIGNTKHLWPIFLRWLDNENKKQQQQQQQQRANDVDVINNDDNGNDNNGINKSNKEEEGNNGDDEILISDPLDTYEQTIIENSIRCELLPLYWYDLYYSSVYTNPVRLISMGRIASYAGFSYLDDETHLNIHPEYGTWHSYRAVLLVAVDEEDDDDDDNNSNDDANKNIALSLSLSSLISEEEAIASKLAFDNALQISSAIGISNEEEDDVGLIGTAKEVDVDAIKDQLCEELGEGKYNTNTDADNGNDSRRNKNNRKEEIPLAWMKLRDSISIGRQKYKYDNNQLLYHYTKDTKCLIDGMKQLNK